MCLIITNPSSKHATAVEIPYYSSFSSYKFNADNAALALACLTPAFACRSLQFTAYA
jgi:hypothetical protein